MLPATYVIPLVVSTPFRVEVVSAVMAGSALAYNWAVNNQEGFGFNYELAISPTLSLQVLNYIRDFYYEDFGIVEGNPQIEIKKNPSPLTGYTTKITGQIKVKDLNGVEHTLELDHTIDDLIATRTDKTIDEIIEDLKKPTFQPQITNFVGLQLKKRIEEDDEFVISGYEVSVPFNPDKTTLLDNPALPLDYAGKEGVVIRDPAIIDELLNNNGLLRNPIYPPFTLPKIREFPDYFTKQLINEGFLAPPVEGVLSVPRIVVRPEEVPLVLDHPDFRIRFKDNATTTTIKPKEIMKIEDLAQDTIIALEQIGQAHDDCLDYTSSNYNTAYQSYLSYKSIYDSKKAYYDQVVARNGIGYGDISNWYSDVNSAAGWVSYYGNLLNNSVSVVNYWNDLRIKCDTERRNDAIALLDSLLDTCLPCSEIKKIIIFTFGDVVTDSFDSICQEHDEARKTATNCCLKAMCNPCNYKYIKGV